MVSTTQDAEHFVDLSRIPVEEVEKNIFVAVGFATV